MKPSWKDAPDTARYLAMDRNGEWVWFVEEPKPHPELSIWTVQSHYAKHAGWSDPSDDWLSTKERRPDETP